MKKSSLIIFICMIICFFINEINPFSVDVEKCPNKLQDTSSELGDTNKGYVGNIQYFFKNKSIEVTQDGKKLTMNFDQIDISKNNEIDVNDFRIVYTAKFYDKEQLGVDKIQAVDVNEKYLYRYDIMKVGNETKDHVEWELKINDTDKVQVVQLIGEATYNKKSDYYVYDSFVLKYEQSKRELEFWIIIGGMVGIIPLTFLAMFIYILIKGENERPSLGVNNVTPAFTDRDTTGDNSGLTS